MPKLRLLMFLLLLGAPLALAGASTPVGAPVELVQQRPATVTEVAPGVVLVDFERVAFGNLRLTPPREATGEITVHFGEALAGGRVNRKPLGTVRYATARARLEGGKPLVVAPPPDRRNTEIQSSQHPPAILTPSEWGVVLPFRWVEIEGWPGTPRPAQIQRQAAFAVGWDDDAASFSSSDKMLDRVWELCRYSIKATTFAGLYVDGDRERIPYEADAYLNQISHYATDRDVRMARETIDWLMKHPTWPSEWAPHMVFMAHAVWRHTGDRQWLATRYESLKSKLLLERAGPDGLVRSEQRHIRREDIVDWPVAERDGYVFTPVNTVVNAFHLRALALMAELAEAVGRDGEATEYRSRERRVRAVFNRELFDSDLGRYRDGVGTQHTSLHASLFPLAFGLAPEEHRGPLAPWLAQRGMRCSVYAAQYLLEGLFENGQAEAAVALMLAPGDRSWRHMVESGTTITWEAWDQKYKPNQDWNHAWGAAPANLLPRYVLGVRPRSPGWTQVTVNPQPGPLTSAAGKVPTPKGPVRVNWRRERTFSLTLTLPQGVTARVELPVAIGGTEFRVNGKPVTATREMDRWVLPGEVSGQVRIEMR